MEDNISGVMDTSMHPDNSHEFLKKSMSTYVDKPASFIDNSSPRMNDAFRTRMQMQQTDMDYIQSKVKR